MPETHTLTDVTWLLISAALVMLMQGGFTFLESGLVRTKNSINVAIKNFVDFCLSSVLFWIFGFALMFGASYGGWFGTSNFFFSDNLSPWLTAFFLFQLVFCGTATTIISGAVAERMRFSGYLVISFIVVSLIYPVVGHWVWGGVESGATTGWLARQGFIDFAGATVVHSVGGWVALAAIIIIGPRIGRFESKGAAFRGHNLPMSALGALLLWFGWLGFNGGSSLGVTIQISFIMVNTVLAGAFGGLTALMLSWLVTGRPDVISVLNGALAGLVGITASADIMTQPAAAGVGALAGVIAMAVTGLLAFVKIDDAIGAVPVHAAAGIWGTLAIPFFSHPANWESGLGRWDQFLVQLTGVGVTFVWAFGVSFLLLGIINRIRPLRVSPEEEEMGLNVAEHGATTELSALLSEMEQHRQLADISRRVTVEPYTEVGQIAAQYNRVLDRLEELLTMTEAERDNLQDETLRLVTDMTRAIEGDLTVEAQTGAKIDYRIVDAFNVMIDQLRRVIGNVQTASYQVSASANEIRSTAEHLSQGSEFQATQIVDTSSAIEQMSLSIARVSENAAVVGDVAGQSLVSARHGAQAVQDTIAGMNRIRDQVQETAKRIKRLGENAQEIGEAVQLIRDIARRTGILALNASLEAAAAGEAGRGFAVVAEDVKRLAERSANATQRITELIKTTQSETNEVIAAMEESTREVVEGSRLADQAGQTLVEIETVSNRLAELIQAIVQSATQQAQGSEVIAGSMGKIAEVTQQTASGAKHTALSINQLSVLADNLRGSVSTFKLPNGNTGEAS